MKLLHLIIIATAINSWSPASAQPLDCRTGSEAAKKKNYRAALSHLDNCLNASLTGEYRVSMLMVRAQSYMGLKKYEVATNDLEEAVALDKSRNAWPWIEMSIAHREQKQYDKALDAIAEAEKCDEDGPGTGPGMAVFYHKGWALHEAGQYKAAIKSYTQGIPKQPDYGWALYRRALAYEALGDRVRAKNDLRRFVKLKSQDGYEAHVAAKLRKYGFDAQVRKE
jgi:tetratricopeptide (TPR) repeat protein